MLQCKLAPCKINKQRCPTDLLQFKTCIYIYNSTCKILTKFRGFYEWTTPVSNWVVHDEQVKTFTRNLIWDKKCTATLCYCTSLL
jgi:hypothetical protein